MNLNEPLKDKIFVITGDLSSMDRNEAKSKVIGLGGKTTTAISGKTTHLVTGTNPGLIKLKKANVLNIEIIDEKMFLELLKEGYDNFNSSIEVINLDSSDDIDFNLSQLESKEEEEKIKKVCNAIDLRENDESKNSLSWVEKYKPSVKSDLIGNPGAFLQIEKFLSGEFEKKALLINGAPGVGKTSSVRVICNALKFNLIEFNASDTRSKKILIEKLKSQTRSKGFNGLNGSNKKKSVLLMDEVDGMTSDRGGIAELVQIVKKTSIPIICICNDKQNLKMRTLSNHCEGITFKKIDARTVFTKIKKILNIEKVNFPDSLINEIIFECSCDMRYILNTIQNNKNLKDSKKLNIVKKDQKQSIFEITSEIFKTTNIKKKMDLFFKDYSFIPLFTLENYLKPAWTKFYNNGSQFKPHPTLEYLAEASDYIGYGDIVDSKIHGTSQDYSMLPYYALFSTVLPSRYGKGGRSDFPSYLGQLSARNGNLRHLKIFTKHFKYKSDVSKTRIYSCPLIAKYLLNFLQNGSIEKAGDCMKESEITKDDFDVLIKTLKLLDEYKKIPTKFKSQFTKECKRNKVFLPYNTEDSISMKGDKNKNDDEKEEDSFEEDIDNLVVY